MMIWLNQILQNSRFCKFSIIWSINSFNRIRISKHVRKYEYAFRIESKICCWFDQIDFRNNRIVWYNLIEIRFAMFRWFERWMRYTFCLFIFLFFHFFIFLFFLSLYFFSRNIFLFFYLFFYLFISLFFIRNNDNILFFKLYRFETSNYTNSKHQIVIS